ncbi:unnamed protein product [Paramecium pentaurelia]|uniref:Uncharacterized protein n=1 Tax=Paramecium pentaurelia TaxID=43138 RepID=A0A8S1V7U9_9CILI|nr:unnamed protein product [Paramecium pentaurelia]
MKQRIKIVFQEEYNLENLIDINRKRKQILNKPKQKYSDDEIQDQSDESDISEQIYDWRLDLVINSPNSRFIAFNINKENDYEERCYFHVIIDTLTKKIKYQRKFYDNTKMLFTYDSKYLIIEDDSENFLVDLETFKEISIDKKHDSIISIDYENNIYKLSSKQNKPIVFCIQDNQQQTININQEIMNEVLINFEKLYQNYAFVKTLRNNFLVFLSNNKILQRSLQKNYNQDSQNWIFNNSIIVQQVNKPNQIYVQKLNNFKIIRKFKYLYDDLIFKNDQSIYKYNFSKLNYKDGNKIERTNLITGITIKPDLDLGKYNRNYYKQVFITQKYFVDLANKKLRYFRILD